MVTLFINSQLNSYISRDRQFLSGYQGDRCLIVLEDSLLSLIPPTTVPQTFSDSGVGRREVGSKGQ